MLDLAQPLQIGRHHFMHVVKRRHHKGQDYVQDKQVRRGPVASCSAYLD